MLKTSLPARLTDRFQSARSRDLAALLAGLSLTLAFAPFNLFPLAVLAPALLFLLWRGATPGRAAWRGWLFGFGLFIGGVSWIYVSLHYFGHMAAPLAILAVLIFCSILALYPAAVGALQAWFGHRTAPGTRFLLLLPALWVLGEWCRGWWFGGFPWLNLGYSQTGYPLAGLAPVFGVYGVSLLTAVTAGALAWWWQCTLTRKQARVLWASLAGLWLGAGLTYYVPWVTPKGDVLRVALVQGNVPLARKWAGGQTPSILEDYVRLSRQHDGAQLIVWPEASVPTYLDRIEQHWLPHLLADKDFSGVDFMFGVVERVNPGTGWTRLYNSVVVASGDTRRVYRKRHLVPFGEFMPLRPVFGWLLEVLRIPMSDFAVGDGRPPQLEAAGHTLGVSVCYEDAFGEDWRAALPQSSVLVNLSEDAWFGNSLAPHQRVQIARMRALELGRPLVRAANTGPSLAMDQRGRVLARTAQFEPAIITVSVQPTAGSTPFVLWGNAPTIGFALACLLFGYPALRRRPA